MSAKTTLTIEDSVARIRMDDGKVNAMDLTMLTELSGRFEEVAGNAAVTVLSGREGIFSAGFDLNTFKAGPEARNRMLEAGVQLILKILEHPQPVLTVCTGHAYPMGAFLMMSADLRLGITGDFRIGMNEVAIGLTIPEFALQLARARLNPAGFARVSTAAMFRPEQAVEMGYLDEVCLSADLPERVADAVQYLKKLDPAGYVGTKARMHRDLIAALRRDTGEGSSWYVS